MFWAAIVGDSIIGPCWVVDGVKIDSEGYCAFLNEPSLKNSLSSYY